MVDKAHIKRGYEYDIAADSVNSFKAGNSKAKTKKKGHKYFSQNYFCKVYEVAKGLFFRRALLNPVLRAMLSCIQYCEIDELQSFNDISVNFFNVNAYFLKRLNISLFPMLLEIILFVFLQSALLLQSLFER